MDDRLILFYDLIHIHHTYGTHLYTIRYYYDITAYAIDTTIRNIHRIHIK